MDTGRFMVVKSGVSASCCFRAVPVCWDEEIMREIARMGHEDGEKKR